MISNLSRVKELVTKVLARNMDSHITCDAEGRSLHFSSGAGSSKIVEISGFPGLMEALAFSDPLRMAISSTNALQGARTWSERGMDLTWTYSEGQGLDVSIQLSNWKALPKKLDGRCFTCFNAVEEQDERCKSCGVVTPGTADAIFKQRSAINAIEREKQASMQGKFNVGCLLFFLVAIAGLVIFGIMPLLRN